ncbi:hypothetical protein [uncultured Oceanicoccus sp.]|uniref:hypothetical protein n=1 Tax=uncultured Oceanicoccus sp. TaxID=1706381 RepID=UPI0030D80891
MFDTSAEFNKIASTEASDLFGAIPEIDRAIERRFAGQALTGLARAEMAKRGMTTQPQPTQSSPSVGDRLWGLAGNALSSAVSAGVGSLFNKSYADTSTPVTMNQITSPQSYNQTSQAVQGVYDSGFSWNKDPWQGSNPYTFNMGSWE